METQLRYPVDLGGTRTIGSYPARPVGLALGDDISIGGVAFNPLLLGGAVLALFGAVYLFGAGKQKRRQRRVRRRLDRLLAQERRLRSQL